MRKLLIISCALILVILGCSKEQSASDIGGGTGEAGSMAAMTIVGDYMYRIADQAKLEVYFIGDDTSAELIQTLNAGSGLETLFPYGNKLLIGTTSGMLIYDITNGASPSYISTYAHMVSCDPVVAQGNYAYVTLRNGDQNRCNRGLTQLEVIDISNLQNPKLVKIVDMLYPHGLDADGNNLVVGEGFNGFKWMDISDPENPTQTYFETNVPCYDVISRGSTFIVVGDKGLYQFSYAQPKPEQLSVIPIEAP